MKYFFFYNLGETCPVKKNRYPEHQSGFQPCQKRHNIVIGKYSIDLIISTAAEVRILHVALFTAYLFRAADVKKKVK